MSVCPSDGFVDKDMDNLGEYLLSSDHIVLNCPLAEPQGYEISCLGMLDKDAWTTMMIVAGHREVKILTGDCGTCDDRQACALSVDFFKEVHQVWLDHAPIKIEIAPSKAGSEFVEPTSKSNTNLMDTKNTSFREKGKKKIKELFPDILAEEAYTLPKTRQWLSAVLTLNQDLKIPYKTIQVNDKCTSCGVCSKICPQDALHQVQKEDKILLIYEPSKCVQCARCVEICGPEAMELEYKELSNKYITGKILLCTTTPRHCTQCGKQIFHNIEPRLCMACASKDHSLKGILY